MPIKQGGSELVCRCLHNYFQLLAETHSPSHTLQGSDKAIKMCGAPRKEHFGAGQGKKVAEVGWQTKGKKEMEKVKKNHKCLENEANF